MFRAVVQLKTVLQRTVRTTVGCVVRRRSGIWCAWLDELFHLQRFTFCSFWTLRFLASSCCYWIL